MGYKGVSFPLQLNKRGGILLSDTTVDAPTHLSQALEQLINTRQYDRVMEVTHCCGLNEIMFENNQSARTMAKSIILDAIANLEDRITVTEDDIEITTTENGLLVQITYTADDLGIQETVPISIGGSDNIG